MNKKEIKDYLKKVNDLEVRLAGEDKETFAWLIYGYNQCAKLLNEKEQQVKKQKEVINKLKNKIKLVKEYDFDKVGRYELLDILKEVER